MNGIIVQFWPFWLLGEGIISGDMFDTYLSWVVQNTKGEPFLGVSWNGGTSPPKNTTKNDDFSWEKPMVQWLLGTTVPSF